MASAYAYADGGQLSKELESLILIERFGVQAIFNRPYLGGKELKDMIFAENVYKACVERKQTDNVVEWDMSNPSKADLIHAAYKAAVKFGFVKEEE